MSDKGFIPTFQIFKGNENLTARFQDRALSINVELASGGGSQDSVEITLDDREYLIATPKVKDRLDIHLGYEGVGTTWMGSFEINSIRFTYPPQNISIRGTTTSSLNDIKSQKVTEYKDKTVEEILAQAGSAIGMKVDVHPSIADQKIPFLNSTTSFGHLIGKLETHYGAVAKIMDGRVTLTPRGEGKSVSDIAMPTLVLRGEHFADYEVIVDSRGATAKTSARYVDKTTNLPVYVDAQTKLKDLDTDATHTIQTLFNTKEEAQKAAESSQGQLDRSIGKIGATLSEGDPWVMDQQRIVIAGIRDGVNGSYTVDIISHKYSKGGGLRTSFTATAGVNGLSEEYAEGAAPDQFLNPAPGQIMGQALKLQPPMIPDKNSSVGSLIGQPAPPLSD